MFARIHALFLFSTFALFASTASAAVVPRGDSGDTCNANSGTQQCCNNVQEASDSLLGILEGLLGINIGPVTGLIGVDCSPIVGSTQCNSQAVCCNGNTFNGVIVIGCYPINVNL